MIPEGLFSPLSNKNIKKLLLGAIAFVVIAIIINNNIENNNKKLTIEVSGKTEEVKAVNNIALAKESLEKNSIGNKENNTVEQVKPLVSAEEYLVGNIETGEIYIAKNTKKIFPIASISKLITALLVNNVLKPDQEITITNKMLEPYSDAGHLSPGEVYSPMELLYPLLLESSNDAAEAIAESYGYDDFIYEMNSIVYEIGMENTSFSDPSGLSYMNKSNAEDLFVLAKYIFNYDKPILNITKKVDMITSTTGHGEQVYKNINPFSLESNFIGGKTGRTNEAKESMLSLFNYKNGDKSYNIAIIVLRSEFNERENDTKALLKLFMEKVQKSI